MTVSAFPDFNLVENVEFPHSLRQFLNENNYRDVLLRWMQNNAFTIADIFILESIPLIMGFTSLKSMTYVVWTLWYWFLILCIIQFTFLFITLYKFWKKYCIQKKICKRNKKQFNDASALFIQSIQTYLKTYNEQKRENAHIKSIETTFTDCTDISNFKWTIVMETHSGVRYREKFKLDISDFHTPPALNWREEFFSNKTQK
jgi:hypothetical protein